jgi:glucokinase
LPSYPEDIILAEQQSMTFSPLFVGLDVGGTTMKAGVVDDTGRPLSAPVSLPTEAAKGQEHGLAVMAETVRQTVAAAGVTLDRIAAVGVATPGSMDIPAGLILDPPNLKPWQNVPVRQYIADAFRLPTAFQNDANAAAYGEHWAGAGKEFRSMVLFTLGTGIGGGIILGGQVLEGEHSHGAELGHMKIELTNARACGCGKRGCLEAYASATAVVQRTHEALNADRGRSSLHALLREQDELTARDVFQAAAAGDELASKVVDDTAFYLAAGASNAMHAVDPDVVCFAGGMTAAGEPFLKRIREHVKALAFPVPAARCQIRYARLGSDAGFIGAAGCARQLWLKQRGR